MSYSCITYNNNKNDNKNSNNINNNNNDNNNIVKFIIIIVFDNIFFSVFSLQILERIMTKNKEKTITMRKNFTIVKNHVPINNVKNHVPINPFAKERNGCIIVINT